MSDCTVYVGDEGTKILVQLVECDQCTTMPDICDTAPITNAADISTATVMEFKFLKPLASDTSQKELVTKTGSFETDGTDGQLYYITEAGFVDVKGTYKLQVRVELPSGKWYSTDDKFTVKDPLQV